eukprot:gene3712-3975_t
MATSILAVVRAASPAFRNRADQLAFAVHAAVLTNGFRLVAVGAAAQLDALSTSADDASTDGWNSIDDQYTFAYISDVDAIAGASDNTSQPTAAAQPLKLLLKALVLGDSLLTTLASDSPTTEPAVLELLLDDFTLTSSDGSAPGAGAIAKTYRNLDQLADRVASALSKLKGHDDIMPFLGEGPGGITGPGMLPAPPGFGPTGGGMHVGPNHPFFSDRMSHPDIMPGRAGGMGGRGGAPGVRWDPISPEGLQGWHPDDFQRGGGGRGAGGLRGPVNPDPDPDIGLPGPGRGPDWDSMYG